MVAPSGPLPGGVETDVPGLFLAGDIVAGRARFIAAAQGQGQRAAILASEFVSG